VTEPPAPQTDSQALQDALRRTAEKGTTYVVLRKIGSEEQAQPQWMEYGRAHAASSTAAIRECAGIDDQGAAEYVAVPARSWKPVKVTVETKQTVKLG
jgi:hypothetical protein